MMDLTNCSSNSSATSSAAPPKYILGVDIGMRNMALCLLDAATCQVVFFDVLDILLQRSILHLDNLSDRQARKLDKKCSKKASVYELIEGVVQTLKNVQSFNDGMQHLCHVVIENQPHFKLPHMKNISVAVHTFYSTILPECMVEYMQPLSKFSGLGIDKKRLDKYAARKKMAVQCCRERLEHYGDARGMAQLALFKKKDDVADAYLLALRGVNVV